MPYVLFLFEVKLLNGVIFQYHDEIGSIFHVAEIDHEFFLFQLQLGNDLAGLIQYFYIGADEFTAGFENEQVFMF